jgi:hypothetical protein
MYIRYHTMINGTDGHFNVTPPKKNSKMDYCRKEWKKPTGDTANLKPKSRKSTILSCLMCVDPTHHQIQIHPFLSTISA